DLRPLLPEGGIRERLERLVQVPEFARDPQQVLLLVELAVERPELVADPVEPLEQRVELAVVEALALHRGDLSPRARRCCGRSGCRGPAARADARPRRGPPRAPRAVSPLRVAPRRRGRAARERR